MSVHLSVHAVVLAAGLGTRMRSPLAKVLHPLSGMPMVGWIVASLREVGAQVTVVVHHQEEAVRAALPGCAFVRQEAPRGTGDALRFALPTLPASGAIVVCAGDTPLLTAAAIRALLAGHAGHTVTVAAFEAVDPTGYGRMVGGVGIVEEGDCTDDQRKIRLVNSGLYVFDAAYLRSALPSLRPHAPKGEFYLTDLVGPDANVVCGFDPALFLGVNDRAALADARSILRRRIVRRWALDGVDFADVDSVSIDASVTLHPDARIGPGVVIEGASDIAGEVGPYCVLKDVTLGVGARILAGSHCDGARVASGAVVGPMARLRPGSVIEEGAHVGKYVEVKNTVLRRGAKANHLTYLGDADVGEGANIGAGTITCNYDGVRKHRTTIGAGAFIGSNTALVAPVSVGDGAIVGAGTIVAVDVPADGIAVGRAPFHITPNAAERLRRRYRLLADAKK